MDEAGLVRGGDPSAGAEQDVRGLRHRQPPQAAPEAPPEVLAAEELHHDEGRRALGTVVGDRHDIGMVDPRRGLGLAEEPDAGAWVGGQLRVQHLERHRLAELDVPRLVHRPHAAGAEWPDDLVPPQRRPGQEGSGVEARAGDRLRPFPPGGDGALGRFAGSVAFRHARMLWPRGTRAGANSHVRLQAETDRRYRRQSEQKHSMLSSRGRQQKDWSQSGHYVTVPADVVAQHVGAGRGTIGKT